MKAFCLAVLLVAVVSPGLCPSPTSARETHPVGKIHTVDAMSDKEARFQPLGLSARAVPDTVFLGSWDFDDRDHCDDDGWVPEDASVLGGEYWHVDNFAGLLGGSFGLLVPIEGNQSMWMGARATGPENSDLCSYAALPGYGNSYDQRFCTKQCLNVSTAVELVLRATWDSEPAFDGTYIEMDNCDGNWQLVRPAPSTPHLSGVGVSDSLLVETISDGMHSGQIRLRFRFVSDGAFSDQDGLWDSDGGIIIDSLLVTDSGGTVLPMEDFEDEAVGNMSSDDWEICNVRGFSYGNNSGNYSNAYGDLFPALSLVQQDPCETEASCAWAFIQGSLDNYACGGFLAQAAVPMGPNSDGLYIHENIVSPVVPLTSTSPQVEVAMRLYTDNPKDNLVFWTVSVRTYLAGCPTLWRSHPSAFRDASRTWATYVYPVGSFIEPGATEIQIRTGVIDLCGVWCGVEGSGTCHSHAPLWDAVSLYALETTGPAIDLWPGGMFNDNFSQDGTLTGTVRMDAALDLTSSISPTVLNGDSSTVVITDIVDGLSTGAIGGDSWASCYAYVNVHPQGKYSGDQITDDAFRWPVIDSTTSPDGDEWYVVRLDTVFYDVARNVARDDVFCLDLNDDLFVPGDTIEYFFAAQSADLAGSWTYYYDRERATDISVSLVATVPGTTDDITVAYLNPMEATCLPTQHLQAPATSILYVDAADGRGVQPYFDTVFRLPGIIAGVDRFDVSESGSNSLGYFGTRVQNLFEQLIDVYQVIVWSSGDLDARTVGDGTGNPLKTDDFGILYTFLDQHDNLPGLYLSGNGLASEWASLIGPNAVSLKSVYMNFTLLDDDHTTVPGMPFDPLGTGSIGGIFDHILGPDTLIARGGCPVIRRMDVLDDLGTSVLEMKYNDDVTKGAVLSQTTPNQAGSTARVVLSGFSLDVIRDDVPAPLFDRADHLNDILAFFQQLQTPTAVAPTLARNSLAQNYPNPFNPETTIDYSLRTRSRVTLRIYNVSGQLVRALVDDVKAGGPHQARWDGRNNAGQQVASGVYFYKLRTEGFTQTKKMVLLK